MYSGRVAPCNGRSTGAAAVATGNIGCMMQIGAGASLPVLHIVELLDWATGGPRPTRLRATEPMGRPLHGATRP